MALGTPPWLKYCAECWFPHLQALFRKIAAALPGMESLSAAKTEDLVDINLSATASQNRAGTAASASGCAC